LGVAACATTGAAEGTPILPASGAPASGGNSPPRGTGLADEIKGLVELGTPPALIRALDIIRSRDLGGTEFGRAMAAVAVTLMQRLYPEISVDLPPIDPPAANQYARILREAERGAYMPASAASSDYLEHVLPFIALMGETRPDRLSAALPDLQSAAALRTVSVLEPYFSGVVAERRGDLSGALAAYDRARAVSAEVYPAVVGAARVLSLQGNSAEAVDLLTELSVRYPDNLLVKRELARAFYDKRDWPRAANAVAEILQRDPKDSRFLLMRAHILVEQGFFTQAQPLLDALAAAEASNRLYLFLRARVQAEGYKNRDSALTYLRSLLRLRPDDEEALAYAVRLLLDSARADELAEGRALLARLVSAGTANPLVLELALRDAIARSSWREALGFAQILLESRRSPADLRNAYAAYRGLGDGTAALAVARELFERDQSNLDWAGFYIGALIAAGQRAEALRLVDARLPTMAAGVQKSRFFYYRSRLRSDEESAMGDLRSSLFEDPRNLDALVAMLEIYRSRKDERRAVYYLKQALALAPEDPTLLKYRDEYAQAMGAAP
jgi:tetratricopeptide (TPR) repeat protein